MSHDWNFGKLLGKGANGEAYLAYRLDYITQEPDRSETYVIKKVPIGRETVLSKSAKLRETQLLAMIKHPYTVTYEDCFIEDGNLYVVMEFAGGGTMERYCDPGTPLISRTLLYDTFVQCVLAVGYLHARKIVHRDLKPANVFVLEDQSVKLGDLGEGWLRDTDKAKERWQDDPAQQGTIVGTPYYLAPECWRGDCTDLDKADVWALGVLLYELCGKSRPFLAKNIHALAMVICKDEVQPPAGKGKGTLKGYPDADLEQAVHRMLDKDATTRYTCQQVLEMPCFAESVARVHKPEEEWDAGEGAGVQASLPPSSFLFQWGLASCRPKCVESLLHKNVIQVCVRVWP